MPRFFSFYFSFSGLPINFWYYFQTFWTLKYEFRAENFFWIFFQILFEFWGDFQDFGVDSFLENSPRTPRNRFHIPRSPRNVNLSFLDSSIAREMKFSEELPSLMGYICKCYWFYGPFATHSFTNFNIVYDILLAVKIRSKVNYFGMLHRGLFFWKQNYHF